MGDRCTDSDQTFKHAWNYESSPSKMVRHLTVYVNDVSSNPYNIMLIKYMLFFYLEYLVEVNGEATCIL